MGCKHHIEKPLAQGIQTKNMFDLTAWTNSCSLITGVGVSIHPSNGVSADLWDERCLAHHILMADLEEGYEWWHRQVDLLS